MKTIRIAAVFVGLALLAGGGAAAKDLALSARVIESGGFEVTVKPIEFAAGDAVSFRYRVLDHFGEPITAGEGGFTYGMPQVVGQVSVADMICHAEVQPKLVGFGTPKRFALAAEMSSGKDVEYRHNVDAAEAGPTHVAVVIRTGNRWPDWGFAGAYQVAVNGKELATEPDPRDVELTVKTPGWQIAYGRVMTSDVVNLKAGDEIAVRYAGGGAQYFAGLELLTGTKKTTETFTFESGNCWRYRVLVDWTDAEGKSRTVRAWPQASVLAGPRQTMSIVDDGWQMLMLDGKDPGQAPPADAKWPEPGAASTFAARSGPGQHCAWYRRELHVPASMHGKRIALRFDSVMMHARVYVNGTKVADYLDGYNPFEADITAVVDLDAANEVLVAVTDWTAALTGDKGNKEPPDMGGYGGVVAARSAGRGLIAPTYCRWNEYGNGITGDVKLVARPRTAVADCLIVPSFAEKTIRVDWTVVNATDEPFVGVLSGSVGAELATGDIPLAMAPGERKLVSRTIPWPNPRLWFPHDPHLYTFFSRIRTDTGEIDQMRTRFGFRDVAIDGKAILINGRRLKCCSPNELSCWTGWSPRQYESMIARGFYLSRIHGGRPEEESLHVADEMGMMIESEIAVMSSAYVYNWDSDEFWRNYENAARGWAFKLRNHPSALLLSMENESFQSGAPRPHIADRCKALTDKVETWNPSLRTLWEGGRDMLGRSAIVGMHYPHHGTEYPDLPNSIYWLNKNGKLRTGDGPTLDWNNDKPILIGEYGWVHWYQQHNPHGLAYLGGERAYTSFEEQMVSFDQQQIMLTRGYRDSEVTAMTPWHGTTAKEKALVSVAAMARQYDKSFFSGEKVAREINVHNDLLQDSQVEVAWGLVRDEVFAEQGREALHMDAGQLIRRTVHLQLPEVSARTELHFELRTRLDGKPSFTDRFAWSVLPRRTLDRNLADIVALYDPVGRTAAALKSLNVDLGGIDNLSALAGFKAVVIGADALKLIEDRAKLTAFADAGGCVVIAEQSEWPAGWLLGMTADDEVSVKREGSAEFFFAGLSNGTIAHPRVDDHPLLAGLTRQDLRWWRDDHVVARRIFRKPVSRQTLAVADMGNLHGLNFTPLAEFTRGKGRIICCQLLISAKAQREPAAVALWDNILTYATAPQPYRRPVSLGVLAQPNGAVAQALESAGVPHENLLVASAPVPFVDMVKPYATILVDANKAVNAAEVNTLAQLAETGSTIWLHNVTPKRLEQWRPLLPDDFALEALNPEDAEDISTSLGSHTAWKLEFHPLLAGLCNTDFYWGTNVLPAIEKTGQFLADGAICTIVRYRGKTDAAQPLIEPGAFFVIPMGTGRIVIDQVLWEDGLREEEVADYARRIVGRLSTNLSAR